jgi:uncharacterized membrane-anchored protein
MSDSAAPTGTLEVAMAQALRLLDQDPALAFEQAREILAVHPGHPPARLLQAAARRRGGDPAAALALLEPLLQAQPDWSPARYEHRSRCAARARRPSRRCGNCCAFNRPTPRPGACSPIT